MVEIALRAGKRGQSFRLTAGAIALGATRDGGRGQYAERTRDGLLRHVVYLGEREAKPASRYAVIHPMMSSASTAYRPCE
jgi:hypothetical protein